MHRWIKKNSKGFALLNEDGHEIRYVFDISVTSSPTNRSLRLWEIQEEDYPEFIEMIDNKYGPFQYPSNALGEIIIKMAEVIAQDNCQDYLSSLIKYNRESHLEYLEEHEIQTLFENLVSKTIAFEIINRCGLDTSLYLDEQDFYAITNFNSLDTIGQLGMICHDLCEMGMQDISVKAREIMIRTFAKESQTIDNENNFSLIQPKQKEKLTSESSERLSTNTRNKIILNKNSNHSTTKFNQNMPYSHSFKLNNSYTKRMKSFMMIKHKTNIKTSKEIANRPIQTGNILVRTWKSGSYVLTKAVHGISHLWSYGTGLIILVVITLFIGVFACLSDNGGINSEIEPLSAEVLAYEETITKYAEQFKIENYVPILEAIMMQESGGKENNPMQSSESGFNTKYPRKPNGITDADYSIEVGVQTFLDCLTRAKVDNPSDTKKLYLALQGYNYGSGYIEWAVSNFGGYSKANAKVFSDMKKCELDWITYGDPDYVPHVMRYVGFAFRCGTNPNFDNYDAWVNINPYAQAKLYGQCTWFGWGRFYELYGYSPGFIGDGWKCVDQLLKTHGDKFERSTTPKPGAVFSGIGRNHVGIVIAVDEDTLTIQEGNLDGKTNTFKEAQTDWHTKKYTLSQLRTAMQGVVFANPK